MKNITISIPDQVYRKARMYAASRDTSVSAVVRQYLKRYSELTPQERRMGGIGIRPNDELDLELSQLPRPRRHRTPLYPLNFE
ncbi:MAG TPA: DUF6364 family protein [Terracidiphilus sp.]|nr:DUF6364 family protein [Terracidiphilus sp.]